MCVYIYIYNTTLNFDKKKYFRKLLENLANSIERASPYLCAFA